MIDILTDSGIQLVLNLSQGPKTQTYSQTLVWERILFRQFPKNSLGRKNEKYNFADFRKTFLESKYRLDLKSFYFVPKDHTKFIVYM